MPKLPENDWRHEIYKLYRKADGIDVDIIAKLVRSLRKYPDSNSTCSVNHVMKICNDKGKWAFDTDQLTKTGKRKQVEFHRIRNFADFLGVPPWFLLDVRYNASLETYFKLHVPSFDIFTLDDLEGQLKSIKRKLIYYSWLNEIVEELQYDVDAIIKRIDRAKLKRSIGRNGEVRDPSSVEYLCNTIIESKEFYSRTFRVELASVSEEREPTIATVRLVQGVFPEFQNTPVAKREASHFWRSAWIAYNYADGEATDCFRRSNPLYDIMLRFVFSNHYGNQGKLMLPFLRPCSIKANDSGRTVEVQMWHSLRQREILDESIEILDSKASLVPNFSTLHDSYFLPPMEISSRFSALGHSTSDILFTEQDLHQLLSWFNLDVPKQMREEITLDKIIRDYFLPRTNALQFLIDHHYLKFGDHVELSWTAKACLGSHAASTPRIATVVNHEKGPELIWEFNQTDEIASKEVSAALDGFEFKNTNIVHWTQLWCKVGETEDLASVISSLTLKQTTNKRFSNFRY